MEDTDWSTVSNPRREKRKTKLNERIKWNQLKEMHPHLILPNEASALSKKLNIYKLDTFFKNEDIIEDQIQGWEFLHVQRPQDESIQFEEDRIYRIIPLDNGYGDMVIFTMRYDL